jgi:hypothetical protein
MQLGCRYHGAISAISTHLSTRTHTYYQNASFSLQGILA